MPRIFDNIDRSLLPALRDTIQLAHRADFCVGHSKRRVYVYEAAGKVEYDEFYPDKSKPIIDEIDTVLAGHYGFTAEELDFIVNYDIKYRMGRDAREED